MKTDIAAAIDAIEKRIRAEAETECRPTEIIAYAAALKRVEEGFEEIFWPWMAKRAKRRQEKEEHAGLPKEEDLPKNVTVLRRRKKV